MSTLYIRLCTYTYCQRYMYIYIYTHTLSIAPICISCSISVSVLGRWVPNPSYPKPQALSADVACPWTSGPVQDVDKTPSTRTPSIKYVPRHIRPLMGEHLNLERGVVLRIRMKELLEDDSSPVVYTPPPW